MDKQRKRKRLKAGRDPGIDPLAGRYSMLELNRHTSQIMRLARKRPIFIDRYKLPFVCVVPHDAWLEAMKIDDFVPNHHPLVSINNALEPLFRRYQRQLRTRCVRDRLRIGPQTLVRGLLLQALYSLPTVRVLRDSLVSNMTFRWFVGMAMGDPVWDSDLMAREMRLLLRNREVVTLLAQAMELAIPCIPDALNDMHLNFSLIETWRAPHDRLKGHGDGPSK
ncbi:Transposase domain (DUF772) [Bordetella ansorpii]|uniref:Transposase domain (DUF772) n=1 Tax=Bordetella ansorpii TaxID=288768 RepID=A0A157QN07_9BORD|nr:transposase [Bordetella ansorpii]SAI47285.1 Transposase domain (DUF772) [Bordetella ansorpii]